MIVLTHVQGHTGRLYGDRRRDKIKTSNYLCISYRHNSDNIIPLALPIDV